MIGRKVMAPMRRARARALRMIDLSPAHRIFHAVRRRNTPPTPAPRRIDVPLQLDVVEGVDAGRLLAVIRPQSNAENGIEVQSFDDLGWRCRTRSGDHVNVSRWSDRRAADLTAPLDPVIGRPTAAYPRNHRIEHIGHPPGVDDPGFDRLARRCDTAGTVVLADHDYSARESDAIAHLAARGVRLSCANPGRLAAALGPELARMVPSSPPHSHEQELTSVRLRRQALLTHGGRAWANRFLERIAVNNRPGSSRSSEVTVLLASKRPQEVLRSLHRIAEQRHVTLQTVVGLHGHHFPGDLEEQIAAMGGSDTHVRRFDESVPFGKVLAELTQCADAPLVTKWDDDDWYGLDHVSDLLLAHDYSGAQIVGKRAEFVYLETSDETIRRSPSGSEAVDWLLAGGTLMTSVEWLNEIGGWKPVHHSVDRELLDQTQAYGGVAYRTHGYQYVLRRSASGGHTWTASDQYFLDAATERRPSLDLAFADIEQNR